MKIVRWLAGSCLLLLPGCAHLPPALPPAAPAELPAAWLDALRAASCTPSLKANLRCRVTGEQASPITLDGTFAAWGGDSLQVNGSYGPFRPIFALAADRDSVELLVHEERRYWVVSRRTIDWEHFNPAAWAQALAWSLCPRDLFSQFEAKDRGRMEGELWRVEGKLPSVGYDVKLAIDIRHAWLAGIELSSGEGPVLVARLLYPTQVGAGWVPGRVDLQMGRIGPSLQVEILNAGPLESAPRTLAARTRPDGWRPVGREGMPLALPPPGKRLPVPR
ncbi:MAG: hypothetical protein U0527_01745 [Candidatus Eisenbacteria bacterium]